MRILCFLAIALALFASQCAAQFFPREIVDKDGHEFNAKWYSSELEALREPSLFAQVNTSAPESYRFLWLRSFHHPIAIRMDIHSDGTSTLTAKMAVGGGCYDSCALLLNKIYTISKEETQSSLQRVDKAGFWSAPTLAEEETGSDGARWIIEGVKNGQYHVVDRWSPANGVARELGLMFAFGLARLQLSKDEIY